MTAHAAYCLSLKLPHTLLDFRQKTCRHER